MEMRRLLSASLVSLVAAAAIALAAPGAGAQPVDAPPIPCPDGTAPLFAGGGTALTNGYFFPGTAINEDGEFIGAPYTVEQGCNIHFVVQDPAAITNGHQIKSFKRRKGKPLFRSKMVQGPGETLMITEHVKPGVYPYFCTVHFGMYGLLEFQKPS